MIRKKSIKRKSKNPVKIIKKECMALVKQIVSIRDQDICQKCGVKVYGSNRHRSHVIPVSAGNRLAFDQMNIKILCYHHHLNWFHKNPLEASEWFKSKFPERYAYLQENKGIKQMRRLDWIELKQKLSEELDLMK